MLPYVRTTDAARDMDLMRQVLGDDKLHYFGISYGTELGGVYAHLFPKKVGRAVFDAVVDPTQNSGAGLARPGQGLPARARQLRRGLHLEDARTARSATPPRTSRTGSPSCSRTSTASRIPGVFPRQLTQTAATSGIAQALYSKDFWEYLTEGLKQAYDGDGSVLMLLADSMNGRNQDGAVQQHRRRQRLHQLRRRQAALHRRPTCRRSSRSSARPPRCSATTWPGAWSAAPTGRWRAPPTTRTSARRARRRSSWSATPATRRRRTRAPGRWWTRWARASGVELTYKGQGHGAYDSGNKCVRGAVNGYLLNGKVPPPGPSARDSRDRIPGVGYAESARIAGQNGYPQASAALAAIRLLWPDCHPRIRRTTPARGEVLMARFARWTAAGRRRVAGGRLQRRLVR